MAIWLARALTIYRLDDCVYNHSSNRMVTVRRRCSFGVGAVAQQDDCQSPLGNADQEGAGEATMAEAVVDGAPHVWAV